MANKVSFIIQLKNQFTSVGEKIRRKFRGIKISADQASKSILKFHNHLKKSKKQLTEIRDVALVTSAGLGVLTFGLAKATQQSVIMEDAFADVKKSSDLTGKSLFVFEDRLEEISEKLGKSKLGLAQMAFEGGKLGIASKEMEPFLMMVSKTAISFDIADQEAGRSIGSIRAKMGLMNDDTIKLLDSLNFLADNTSASGKRMIEVVERVSGDFNLLKIPPDVAAGFAAIADQLEVSPELAASGLNMFFNRMTTKLGLTGQLMENPVKTVENVLKSIEGMDVDTQAAAIHEMFGDEAGRFVKKMVANIDLFGETMEKAVSQKAVGSMNRELKNQLERSSKQFQILGATSTNTFESIGDAIKPLAVALAKTLTPIINFIGEFAKKNPRLIQFVTILTVAALSAAILTAGITGLGLAFAFLSASMLPITGAVALLIAAGIMLAANWDGVVGGLTSIWQNFSETVIGITNSIAETFDLLFQGRFIDSLKSAANIGIKIINSLLTPLDFAANMLGFDAGTLKFDEFKIDSPALAPSPQVNQQAAAPVTSSIVNGEILVSAAPGSSVSQTKFSSSSPSFNVGMNVMES